jgi:hypothetical protein
MLQPLVIAALLSAVAATGAGLAQRRRHRESLGLTALLLGTLAYVLLGLEVLRAPSPPPEASLAFVVASASGGGYLHGRLARLGSMRPAQRAGTLGAVVVVLLTLGAALV